MLENFVSFSILRVDHLKILHVAWISVKAADSRQKKIWFTTASSKMPVTVELKYEYYMTWPGRVKIVELVSLSNLWSILWILKAISILKVLALLCMMCAAPAFNSTQHWFLLVVVCGFLGSLFFSLYHLCLDTYLKNVNVGWLPAVSHAKLMHLWDRKQSNFLTIFQEFWFTAATSFLYFTAFTAQLAEFSGLTLEGYQYWVDAQVSAGVSIKSHSKMFLYPYVRIDKVMLMKLEVYPNTDIFHHFSPTLNEFRSSSSWEKF